MSIPFLRAWCWHGDGSWWLGRLRPKWRMEAARDQQQREAGGRGEKSDEQWAADGWHGGKCDPLEQCSWADEGPLDPDAKDWWYAA